MNYQQLDKDYFFNWREERLERAKYLGYNYISESIIKEYKKLKSLKKTGKKLCNISDMSICRFLKFAGIKRFPRGFIRYKKYVNYKGKKYNLSELSKLSGLTRNCIYKRIYWYGFTVEEAMTTPLMIGNRHARRNKKSKN